MFDELFRFLRAALWDTPIEANADASLLAEVLRQIKNDFCQRAWHTIEISGGSDLIGLGRYIRIYKTAKYSRNFGVSEKRIIFAW